MLNVFKSLAVIQRGVVHGLCRVSIALVAILAVGSSTVVAQMTPDAHSYAVGPNRDAMVVETADSTAEVKPDLGERDFSAVRAEARPEIDGDLGDATWTAVPGDDRFTQRFPDEAATPSQRTEMWVAYDDVAVYFAFRLHDDAADEIVARLTRRDRTVEADSITVLIDSRHERHSGYAFTLNAAGIQRDALLSNDSELDYDWDAVWSGAVRRDAGGWTAELAVPLSVLRFDAATRQTWGLQARRYISRRREEVLWAHVPRSSEQVASRMGELTGLKDLRPRRTFELRPFAVLRTNAHSGGGGVLAAMKDGAEIGAETDAGVDLKIGVTSDLTLDVAVNPDFGQVEADEVVLNLTRFETFSPEKRPFFVEGREIFDTPVDLFYSRRVGSWPSRVVIGDTVADTDENGAEVEHEVIAAPASLPIYAAAKLSGKLTDTLSIGALSAVSGDEVVRVRIDEVGGEKDVRLAAARSFSVVRLRREMGGNSYIGMISTAVVRLGEETRRGAANHDALAQGVDGQWQSRDGVWRVTAQALATQRLGGTSHVDEAGAPCADPAADSCMPITRPDGTRLGPGDVGWGALIDVAGRGEHWIGELGYRAYAPRLDPNALGFLPHFNLHRFDAGGAYQVSDGSGAHQYWATGARGTFATTFDGTPRLANVALTYHGQYKNAWSVEAEWGARLPRTWDIVEIGDGTRFERNSGLGGALAVTTDPRGAVQLVMEVFGGFGFGTLPGWDITSSATVKVQPTSALELDFTPQFGWEENFIRSYLPDPCRDSSGAPCGTDNTMRRYLFSELDSGSMSLTARATYTASPSLSVQAYAQTFLSKGKFSRYYRADTTGRRPFIDRRDLVLDETFDGGEDDFEDGTLQVNFLVRWEPSPGSTILAAYTRGQSAFRSLSGSPHFDPTAFAGGALDDVLMLKFTYFTR